MRYSDDDEIRHLEIASKLDRLDELRYKVGLGFVLFWLLWAAVLISVLIYYFT